MLAGKHGHADASFRAAQCLEHGWGCRKDLNKAVSLYRSVCPLVFVLDVLRFSLAHTEYPKHGSSRAAVLSHPGSMHRLGLAEINGELGLTKRPKDGVQWLKRAAELADQVDPPQPQSLHELAILHEKGIDNVIFQASRFALETLERTFPLTVAINADTRRMRSMLPSSSHARLNSNTLPQRTNSENVTSTARWDVLKTLRSVSTTTVSF